MNLSFLDAHDFFVKKQEVKSYALQQAALFLTTGIDLAAALQFDREGKSALMVRIRRLIERERLKGVRRSWSYDLNRHIALKQVHDLLKDNAVQAIVQ